MRRLTRFFNTWAAVTRIHRYADQQYEWTEQDRQAKKLWMRQNAQAVIAEYQELVRQQVGR